MHIDETRLRGQPVIDISTPIETNERGGESVAVSVQDQISPTISTPFLKERAFLALAADTVIDSNDITLAPGHLVTVGETIELAVTGDTKYMQSKVVAVNIDVITLDQPVNRVYTVAGTTVTASSGNMIVDGSITPQVFSVKPLPGQAGDMVRIITSIGGIGPMDYLTFGSDPALTNGCVVRVKLSDGTYRNLFNIKSNSDLIRQGFDYAFLVNTANNIRSFSSRVTWGGQSKHGVVIRLDGDLGEELQVVIQDDLTGLDNNSFIITAQGHELQ